MKRPAVFLLSAVLVLILSACGKPFRWNGSTEVFAELLMAEDVSDPRAAVGMADYVFIGTVTASDFHVIPHKAAHEDSYTTYGIRVDENLKGELTENITVRKMGGYKKDGTMLLIAAEMPDGSFVTDDPLPEVGKQYVFLAYGQPDGSLALSELFDSREADGCLREEYLGYIRDEIPFERERFPSGFAK